MPCMIICLWLFVLLTIFIVIMAEIDRNYRRGYVWPFVYGLLTVFIVIAAVLCP